MKTKIIHFLKEAQGYLSGEEISHDLKISRAGIWKYMQELRKEGYDIVAVPHLGYRLMSCPDKLLPSEIQSGLKTETLGNNIKYFLNTINMDSSSPRNTHTPTYGPTYTSSAMQYTHS